MCDIEAPEAAALTRLRSVEGPGNVHPGQGPRARRFFLPHFPCALPGGSVKDGA